MKLAVVQVPRSFEVLGEPVSRDSSPNTQTGLAQDGGKDVLDCGPRYVLSSQLPAENLSNSASVYPRFSHSPDVVIVSCFPTLQDCSQFLCKYLLST